MARVELADAQAVPEEGRADLLPRRDHRVGHRPGAGDERKKARRGGPQSTQQKLSGTEPPCSRIKIRQADAKIQQARAGLQSLDGHARPTTAC